MREGLDAPTLDLPPANVEEIRAFLDGQSRIKLAVWVRHAHGSDHDHHLVLGVADEDWSTGDMAALEDGMNLPPLRIDAKQWLDLYPVSEVDGLRSFGTVLWEQTTPGSDPLAYRYTYEPFASDPDAVASFARHLQGEPEIRSVGAKLQKLWRADEVVRERVCLSIDAPPAANALETAADAARHTVLAGHGNFSCGLGRPDEAMSILYEVTA